MDPQLGPKRRVAGRPMEGILKWIGHRLRNKFESLTSVSCVKFHFDWKRRKESEISKTIKHTVISEKKRGL